MLLASAWGLRPASGQPFARLFMLQIVSFAGHGMRMVMACPACGATGIVRQEWCTRCGGDGRASSSVTLSVVIPPGEHLDTPSSCIH